MRRPRLTLAVMPRTSILSGQSKGPGRDPGAFQTPEDGTGVYGRLAPSTAPSTPQPRCGFRALTKDATLGVRRLPRRPSVVAGNGMPRPAAAACQRELRPHHDESSRERRGRAGPDRKVSGPPPPRSTEAQPPALDAPAAPTCEWREQASPPGRGPWPFCACSLLRLGQRWCVHMARRRISGTGTPMNRRKRERIDPAPYDRARAREVKRAHSTFLSRWCPPEWAPKKAAAAPTSREAAVMKPARIDRLRASSARRSAKVAS